MQSGEAKPGRDDEDCGDDKSPKMKHEVVSFRKRYLLANQVEFRMLREEREGMRLDSISMVYVYRRLIESSSSTPAELFGMYLYLRLGIKTSTTHSECESTQSRVKSNQQ